MSGVKKWQSIIRRLKVLLEALPSPQERDDLLRGITGIVDVLSELGRSLGNLPTSTEAAKAKDALEKLDDILGRNPLLRGSPPKTKRTIPRKVAPRAGTPSIVPIPRDDILREIDILNQLPEEDLRTQLQQNNHYSSGLLRAILAELVGRIPSKSTKKEMIEQIVAMIVNQRTYKGLREGS